MRRASLPCELVCIASEKTVPTVVLRHDLPDGSHHFDWMVARDDSPSPPLATWRLPRPAHELRCGESVDAVQLNDHRAVYLEYEGEVSDNRGRVRRVARGFARGVSGGAEDLACVLEIRWEGPGGILTQTLSLERRSGENWIVGCVAANP